MLFVHVFLYGSAASSYNSFAVFCLFRQYASFFVISTKKRRRNKTTTTEKKTPTKAKKKKNQRERDNKKSTDVLYEINIKIKMNRATPIRANDVFVKLTSIPCCAFEMRSAATTTKKINADMHVYENSLLGLSPLALLTVCAQTYLVLYFTLIYLLSLLVVCHWYVGFFTSLLAVLYIYFICWFAFWPTWHWVVVFFRCVISNNEVHLLRTSFLRKQTIWS